MKSGSKMCGTDFRALLPMAMLTTATASLLLSACSGVGKFIPTGSSGNGHNNTQDVTSGPTMTTNTAADTASSGLCTSVYFGGKPTDLRPLAIADSNCAAPKPADSYCFRWNFTGGNATPEALAKPDIRNVWMTLDQACAAYSRKAQQ